MALMKATDVIAMSDAAKKRDLGHQLTPDEEKLAAGHDAWMGQFSKKCGCSPDCTKPLEPRIDGERPKIGGVEVNPDCYYEQMGRELDDHPIGGHGIRRSGGRRN